MIVYSLVLEMHLMIIFVLLSMRTQGASVGDVNTPQPANEKGENQAKSSIMFSSLPPGRRQKYPVNRNKEFEVSIFVPYCIASFLTGYDFHLFQDAS